MLKKLINFTVVFFIAYGFTIAQDEILVKADDFKITQTEFLKRFESTPRIQSISSINEQKEEFLLTLVAEKLWAVQTQNQKLQNDTNLELYLKNIEKMNVRDAYFKDEIENKVIITNEEINKEFQKYNSILYFNFLYSESRAEIDSLHLELINGITIDSLLQNRNEFEEQTTPVEVKYEQLDFDMEEVLFNLTDNEFTNPIKMNDGWVIYFLKIKKNIPIPNQQFSDVYNTVSKRLKSKKTKSLYEAFIKEFYKGKKANAVEEQFAVLANEIANSLSNIFELNTEVDEAILYYEDMLKIDKRIHSADVEKPLIRIQDKEISLRHFIHYLGFKNFKISKQNFSNLPFVLNNYIRDFIEMEFLSIAAYEKGYEKSPEIQEELSVWRNNYLAQLYKNNVVDSVKADFNKNYKSNSNIVTEVKVKEVSVNSLDDAKIIFDNIDSGLSLIDAANKMNLPKKETKLNGEDYVPIFQTGSFNETIDQMQIGEVIGPFTKSDGYSIIQLLDRRNVISDSLASLVKEQSLFETLEKVLESKTAELAKRNNISINNELLESLKISDVKMIVYRKFGFGGVLNAAPFVNLFYEWKETYDKLKDISL